MRRTRMPGLLACLVASSACGAAAQPNQSAAAVPDSEAGQRVERLLEAARNGDAATFASLIGTNAPDFVSGTPAYLNDQRTAPGSQGALTLARLRAFATACRYAGPIAVGQLIPNAFQGSYTCNGQPGFALDMSPALHSQRINSIHLLDPATAREFADAWRETSAQQSAAQAEDDAENVRIRGVVDSLLEAGRTNDAARFRALTGGTAHTANLTTGRSGTLDLDRVRRYATKCRRAADPTEMLPGDGTDRDQHGWLDCGGRRIFMLARLDARGTRILMLSFDSEPPE